MAISVSEMFLGQMSEDKQVLNVFTKELHKNLQASTQHQQAWA